MIRRGCARFHTTRLYDGAVPRTSAGLVLYRRRPPALEVLLGHPGGPFYARKHYGAWSIPKGEVEANETPLDAARREFFEETGFEIDGPFLALSPVRLRSGKVIHAWAVEGDCDPARLRPFYFELEWPPRSGRLRKFPEIDRVGFFPLEQARLLLHPGQTPWLDELPHRLRDA